MKKIIIFLFLIKFSIAFTQSKGEIINIWQEAKRMNTNLINNSKKIKLEKHILERKRLEKYNDDILFPTFKKAKLIICLDKDSILFISFLDLLINYKNSADPSKSYVFAEIYECQPDFVLYHLSKHLQKNYLLNVLDYGMMMLSYEKEEKYKYYIDRLKIEMKK